jgi:hypothetical protein
MKQVFSLNRDNLPETIAHYIKASFKNNDFTLCATLKLTSFSKE